MKKVTLLLTILFVIISFSSKNNLNAQLIGGSRLWCKINTSCELKTNANGPDEGSNEWKHCQAKGGCKN